MARKSLYSYFCQQQIFFAEICTFFHLSSLYFYSALYIVFMNVFAHFAHFSFEHFSHKFLAFLSEHCAIMLT